MDKDFKSQLTSDSQNAREDVGRSVTLLALAHSLEGLGARADEVGMGGNAFIARQAAAFVANIEKSVTRLLPEGQLVRHASLEFDVAVGGIDIGPRGEMRVICYKPESSDWWSLPVDELEVVYEINASLFDFDVVGDPLRTPPWSSEIGPVSHVTFRGDTYDLVEGPSASPGPFTLPDETVHHLSVDPDQVVTLHGAWAEGGNGEVSFEDWRPHEIGGMPAPHPIAWPKWIKRIGDWIRR